MTVGFRFTSADLERMPDIEGIRYEIIDGELYVAHQPVEAHQYAAAIVNVALAGWSLQTGAGLSIRVPGLVFSDDNEVIPDVVWISHQRRRLALDDKGNYKIAPEVVVEVLSPGSVNERRDRDVKLNLYSRQGVQEYWIVDWIERIVEVYRPEGGELRLVQTLSDGDTLTSPILPGFACAISSLWAPPIGA